MVCTNGCLENFFLPVSVCFTEGAWSISFTIKFGYVSFEFIGIHYVYCLLQYTGGNVTFIVHLWFAACFPFLCSDDNHTIRSTWTIDGGGRSIFQNSESFDVIRIYHCQRISQTLHTAIIHCQSVDNDQRIVFGVQWWTTANTNRSSSTRSTAGNYIHTGYFTCYHILCAGGYSFADFIRLDGSNWSRQVVFLYCSVTYNDYGVQYLRVIFQCDHYRRSCFNFCCFVTDECNGQNRILRNIQCEVTVKVSDGTRCGTLGNDIGANHGFAHSIFHMSFDCDLLCISAQW